MKECGACKQKKPLNCFTSNKSKKDGLQSYCKECKNQYNKKWQRKNRKKKQEYNKKQRERLYEKLGKYKLERGCFQCGYKEYAIALDFHHKDSKDKQFEIASAIARRGESIIWKEVEKCEVVCANCHRVLHSNGGEALSG